MITILRIFICVFSALFLSCSKETEKKTPVDTDLSLTGDLHRLEDEAIHAFYMLEHMEQYMKVPSSTFPSCASIVFDTTTSSIKKITIDFGNGCKCDAIDGKFRKGKLEIQWEGNYLQENGIRTIKSNNYFVGNGSKYYQYSIDMTVNTLSYTHFTSTENISFNKTSSDKISISSTKTYKWKKGKNTYNELYDDVIQVSGIGNGKNVDNQSFTTSTAESEAIVLDMGCKWLKEGILYLNPENKNQRKISYSDCDSYANVEIQGRVYTINFLTLE